LQKVARIDGSAFGASAAFALGTRVGARALDVATGDLVAGNKADYLVIDATKLDPWSPPLSGLIYRAEDAWVQAAFVGGVRVYTGEASPLAQSARLELAKVAARVLP
jgi:cytosine/adenosine deaminase-related metal-dependent hydrolase